jgi:hypothetical protein
MTGRIGLSGAALSLAIALALPAEARAQASPPEPPPDPAAVPRAEPPRTEPPPSEVPSETPPPPMLVAEEPPLPPVSAADPPLVMIRAESPRRRHVDPVYPIIGAMGGAGILLSIGGLIARGSAPSPEEYCTVSGCVERHEDRLAANVGADMLGAGVGLVAVAMAGIPIAIKTPSQEDRRSTPMAATGFTMTGVGAGALGLGLAQTFTHERDEADMSTSWPLFFASALLLSGGIPLWVIGSERFTEADREHERKLSDPAFKKKRRSPGMVVGGSILTGLGGLGGIAGTGMLIGDAVASGEPTLLTWIIGVPTLASGALFTSIGVPLILSGNRQIIEGEVRADALRPEVTMGAGGLSAAWRLD